jgi:hypothetical protein
MARLLSSSLLALAVQLAAVVSSALAQTSLVVGNNYVEGTARTFVNCSFTVPCSFSSSWDLMFVARPGLVVKSNPSNAEVDLSSPPPASPSRGPLRHRP